MKIEVDDILEIGISSIFLLIATSIIAQIYFPQYETVIQNAINTSIEVVLPALFGAILGIIILRTFENFR